ncbi:MAG: pyridoxal 5'-phosphate synthase glutaminase subunit PdxT [Ilumatobacter sp.]|uniref:pyridoxal 5'-phosphate synthase glutaminase subunit PdxT n=1 Tax=Ilumatobacter sp. TaxID=1967498 RepID=UPI00391DA3BA
MGVLALQGAFGAHRQRLHELGVEAPLVRKAEQFDDLDALVIPGGESTTMSHLLTTNDLFDDLQERIAGGLPVFGTCAGMILCAAEVLDGRPDQRSFGSVDITVRRNGYGRQLASFETDIDVAGLDEVFHAVFIRAPAVERVGPDIEVLAEHEGVPVLLRHGACTVASFHPELTPDGRLHEMFIHSIC